MNQICFSYNKLWKLLIDCGMKKKDLQVASGISAARLPSWGEMVTLQLL